MSNCSDSISDKVINEICEVFVDDIDEILKDESIENEGDIF